MFSEEDLRSPRAFSIKFTAPGAPLTGDLLLAAGLLVVIGIFSPVSPDLDKPPLVKRCQSDSGGRFEASHFQLVLA